MARINLLPWRQELKEQQQKEFLIAGGVAIAATIFLVIGVHVYINNLKEHQERRNRMVKDEIAIVDKKIKKIKDIESKKNKLLTKIEVIQKLQESRPEVVHLFHEVAEKLPEGVFLTKFDQTGATLKFNGKAQSNARVSAFMRAIDASEWMQKPQLNVIRSDKKTNVVQQSDFFVVARLGKIKRVDSDGGK